MLRTVVAFGALASLTLMGSAVLLVGCSSKSSVSGTGSSSSADEVSCEDGGCAACTGPTSTSGTVSFMTDIQPILQNSCGVGGAVCHGQAAMGGGSSPSQLGLYLAEPSSSADGLGNATTILAGIVGVKSLEDPSMNLVTASSPENSFLMHKLDDDMCSFTSQCAPASTADLDGLVMTPCGVQMPAEAPGTGGTPLTVQERTLVWNWIAQGAMNN